MRIIIFTTEQNLMIEFNDLELLGRGKDHRLFMDKTLAFMKDFERGRTGPCRDRVAFSGIG